MIIISSTGRAVAPRSSRSVVEVFPCTGTPSGIFASTVTETLTLAILIVRIFQSWSLSPNFCIPRSVFQQVCVTACVELGAHLVKWLILACGSVGMDSQPLVKRPSDPRICFCIFSYLNLMCWRTPNKAFTVWNVEVLLQRFQCSKRPAFFLWTHQS